jgi:hypothetical protein
MKKYKGKIPFDKGGNLLNYYPGYGEVVWVDNFENHFNFQLEGYGRGRSSVTFDFKCKDTGAAYSMFVSDMVDMLLKIKLDHGAVSGWFTFCKKGQNYGLVFISDDK